MCLSGGFSAQEKFSIFMRHRYHGCVEMLLELLDHEHHHVSVSETLTPEEGLTLTLTPDSDP